MSYIMALDAGTTSNRCILFNKAGEICSVAQKEFAQYYPKPGWVEHDANEIWATQLGVALSAMNKIGARAEDLAANGRRPSSGTRGRANRSAMPASGSAAAPANTATS